LPAHQPTYAIILDLILRVLLKDIITC